MDALIGLLSSLLSRLDVLAAIDILIVAVLIYGLLTILHGTRASVLLRGAIILFVVLFVIVNIWPLQVLRFLIVNSLPAILVAIPVVFAPEIRRALEQIGHTSEWLNRPLGQRSEDGLLIMISEVIKTAFNLSGQRWGGLMVIERSTGLQDVITKGGGIPIEGRVTEQLLTNIFVPNTPLHDGAVIIRGDLIVAAAVILPLSDNPNIQQHYGTRHRAALGISEDSDAVAVVVSEETGAISIAVAGRLYPNPKPRREDLTETLTALIVGSRYPNQSRLRRRNNGFLRNKITGFRSSPTPDTTPVKPPAQHWEKGGKN